MGGGDKPLLEVGGRPMLARVLDLLRAEADWVAISANGDPARFAAFGCPVLDDGAFAGLGPLAGVLAGLDWAARQGADALLTLPGDTPFAPPRLATALAPAPACAASAGRAHHLVALWPVGARDALRRFLSASGAPAAHRFAAALGMRHVPFPPSGFDRFLNVNTPDDLAAARVISDRDG
jgi:molybdopterin-guanine dinucleotide biosynthesis protein A